MASLLAQLPGPINLRLVLSDTKFSDILHDLLTAKGNRSGVPRVLAVDRNETRELAGTLHLEGAPVYSYSYTDNIIPTMTSATTPSGVASASSILGDVFAAWKAFDHNLDAAPYWHSGGGTGWLQYQFPAAHVVTRYAVSPRDGEAYSRQPKSWTFKGSHDGAAWVTLDTRADITNWALPTDRKVYEFPNAIAYAYYRLDITASNDASGLAVGELEMMETVVSHGSGKDDAIAQIRAINALVTVGTTLTLQSRDATYPVTLKVLPSRGVSQPLDELFELDGGPVLASCAFSFTCEPYAYGPELIVFDQSVAVPNFFDFFVPGDYKAPLTISWTPGGARTGYIDRFAMGLLPDQTTPLSALLRPATWGAVTVNASSPAGYPAVCITTGAHGLFNGQHVRIMNAATTPAVSGTDWPVSVISSDAFSIPVAVTAGASGQWSPWTAYDVGAVSDANAYGGIYMSLAANGWSYWEINDTALPRGSYLPFLRVGKTTTGAAPRVKLSQTGDLEAVYAGAYTGYNPGTWPRSVAAPAAVVHGAGVSHFEIGVNAGAAGGAAQFNYLALVPTSWGWITSMTFVEAGFFELLDGIAYIGGSTALAGGVRTGGMTAVGGQRLFFIAGNDTSGTISGQLLVKAVPRYNLWR